VNDARRVLSHAFSDYPFAAWFLALLGIAVFNVLASLKLVSFSQREFLACCSVDEPT